MKFKKFLQKIAFFFSMLFTKVKTWLDNEAPNILRFMNALKMIVDNPTVTMVVAASENKIDDNVLFYLKRYLEKAIFILGVQIECGKHATPEEVISCYLNYLRNCPPEVRNALYAKTASIIAREKAKRDGVKLSNSEIDTLMQIEYSKTK